MAINKLSRIKLVICDRLSTVLCPIQLIFRVESRTVSLPLCSVAVCSEAYMTQKIQLSTQFFYLQLGGTPVILAVYIVSTVIKLHLWIDINISL